jgi:hypothetical protein
MADHRKHGSIATFDSFQGLPEDWIGRYPAGSFKMNPPPAGSLPNNVLLIKGLFNRTLPPFLQDHSALVVDLLHMDANLYSSTIFVLRKLNPHLHKGRSILHSQYLPLSQYMHTR